MNSYYDVEAYFVSRRSFFLMTNCPCFVASEMREIKKSTIIIMVGAFVLALEDVLLRSLFAWWQGFIGVVNFSY